ncbi:hypothetical protein FE257_001718 [Aspergillus nanangensis]|uniref:Uncharacterized protein n=1 Tax=Aspergillus nanangensis TaxID=2582783 RepID=A0AAD4GPG6_ASPNN|nr:hypothetical protein FE257_001718 [Aspergillus nanangensis]
MASTTKAKRFVLAASVTAITIAGTLYGAGVKTDQEVTQTTQKSHEATIDERIGVLRNTRQNLASKKELVERQIHDLDARIEDRKQKALDQTNQGPLSNR